MARRPVRPIIFVLDGDIENAIPITARRDWKEILQVDGMRLRISATLNSVVPPGSLILSHNISCSILTEDLVPDGSNVVVIDVAGSGRPLQRRRQTPYGWRYQRAVAVPTKDTAFRSCLCRFLRVRTAQRPEEEPPFLLLEPAGPGREWKEGIAGRGNRDAVISDCRKRIEMYALAGFRPHFDMSELDAIKKNKKKLQQSLSQLAAEIRQWAKPASDCQTARKVHNETPKACPVAQCARSSRPASQSQPAAARKAAPLRLFAGGTRVPPAWFGEARAFAHDSLKNSICFLACEPERLRRLLAENWEEYRSVLSCLRSEWRKWADEQPTSEQRGGLRLFDRECEKLEKTIGKFIDAKLTKGNPAKKKADEIRGIAWTIHQLLERVCESGTNA